jgi:hypothetical protein
MPIIDTKGCQCAQCGHIWIPGQWRKSEDMPLPAWCAACKSAKWNGSAPIVMKPDTRVAELAEDHAPIERQSSVKPKVEKKVERKVSQPKVARPPAGKLPKCPHGFFIVDGTCACKVCAIG